MLYLTPEAIVSRLRDIAYRTPTPTPDSGVLAAAADLIERLHAPPQERHQPQQQQPTQDMIAQALDAIAAVDCGPTPTPAGTDGTIDALGGTIGALADPNDGPTPMLRELASAIHADSIMAQAAFVLADLRIQTSTGVAIDATDVVHAIAAILAEPSKDMIAAGEAAATRAGLPRGAMPLDLMWLVWRAMLDAATMEGVR